jgi:hypothetical protein
LYIKLNSAHPAAKGDEKPGFGSKKTGGINYRRLLKSNIEKVTDS